MHEAELAAERRWLSARSCISPIFQRAVASGKRVVSISDCYLPGSFLKASLDDAGFAGIERVFVSCAIPTYGYQNHVSIDAGFGFIRKWQTTDAVSYEGAMLRNDLLDRDIPSGCLHLSIVCGSSIRSESVAATLGPADSIVE